MIKKPFIININKEIIDGFILSNNEPSVAPDFVFLHGGGNASFKGRVYEIAPPILKNNRNILSFDFSGHGESTGILKEGSLKKRVNESQEIIERYAAKTPLTICGASMSGYIAIKMLEFFNVNTLILMCPALYDGKAYDVQFNQGFTEIIRQHESWRNTDVISALESFTGRLLIIMGDKDEVIPSGVIELIMKHTKQASRKEIYTIAGSPHKINDWIVNYPEELMKMQQKVFEYL
jgi:uncharacterized protein